MTTMSKASPSALSQAFPPLSWLLLLSRQTTMPPPSCATSRHSRQERTLTPLNAPSCARMSSPLSPKRRTKVVDDGIWPLQEDCLAQHSKEPPRQLGSATYEHNYSTYLCVLRTRHVAVENHWHQWHCKENDPDVFYIFRSKELAKIFTKDVAYVSRSRGANYEVICPRADTLVTRHCTRRHSSSLRPALQNHQNEQPTERNAMAICVSFGSVRWEGSNRFRRRNGHRLLHHQRARFLRCHCRHRFKRSVQVPRSGGNNK
jgi:hypothetical protein